MQNAYEEFMNHIGDRVVKQAIVYKENYNGLDPSRVAILLSSNSDEFYAKLKAIDYDAGYGGQELYGVIWYEDGTYSDRGEYDGSEWWVHHEAPDFNVMYTIVMKSVLNPI